MVRPLPLLLAALLALPAPALAAARRKHGGRARVAHKHGRRVVRERPVATYTRDGMPNIQAEAAVVVDLGSTEELLAKHADDVRPIASISKLMAMMVVLDHNLNLDGVTEILKSDANAVLRGARSRLPPGMRFTNRDLIHAALIASDNRAVLALGRAVGLDPDRFAAAMSQKARELGLGHTTFGDPTGLDERNRSTPRELARMLAAAIRYPLIAEITRKATYVARAVNRPGYAIEYQNTDQVARGNRYQVLAGKTGYTDLAGYCLAIAARVPVEGTMREVAMVFLGDHGKLTRFGDFSRAAQWVTEKRPGSGRPAAPTALPPPAPVGPPAPIAADPAPAPAQPLPPPPPTTEPL